MGSYNGSEGLATEQYVVQGVNPNIHMTSATHLQKIDHMDQELRPGFIIDQGPYYPDAASYYGYYCTGLDSPGEWDDHYGFFLLDGPDPQCTGVQTETLPYVYYTPTYGYSDTPYNPYNPYIPGAVAGVDGPFVGAQQYYATPTYQIPASSPGCFPFLVQAAPHVVPNSSLESTMPYPGSSFLGEHGNLDSKFFAPSTTQAGCPPTSASTESYKTASVLRVPSALVSDGPLVNSVPNTLPVIHGNVTPSKAPTAPAAHMTQGKMPSSTVHPSHCFAYGRVLPLHNPPKGTVPVNNGTADFRPNSRGWTTPDSVRNVGLDVLGEQNRGPRISRVKNKWTFSAPPKTYVTRAGYGDVQGNIIICTNQYNKDDFPVNYQNAKFFVIKSYSEDDVHKSVKYGVWSSTPAGNKKLNAAYEDAQRISGGKRANCPVFLFFSVNASGQFCGVSEMIGPVDFNKDMDFWQQDKWTGSFLVKWHIIKDVPNSNFRHVLLENNEYKPVTNSRDTQEVSYIPGIQMLKIFKNYMSRTSIFDDFMHYEDRQKFMQEEKLKLLRSYEVPYFVPVSAPSNKHDGIVSIPAKGTDTAARNVESNNVERETVHRNGQSISLRATEGDKGAIFHKESEKVFENGAISHEEKTHLLNAQAAPMWSAAVNDSMASNASGGCTNEDEVDQEERIATSTDQAALTSCSISSHKNTKSLKENEIPANRDEHDKLVGKQWNDTTAVVQDESKKVAKHLESNILPQADKLNCSTTKAILSKDQMTEKPCSFHPQDEKREVMEEINSKLNSLSADGNGTSVSHESLLTDSSSSIDVLTVGSLQLRVNGFSDSPATLTIGTISIEQKPSKA